jgi:hypothetical protein
MNPAEGSTATGIIGQRQPQLSTDPLEGSVYFFVCVYIMSATNYLLSLRNDTRPFHHLVRNNLYLCK